ncbi:response regulator [bacterium]|nr:response regulator [bacterium]
MTQSHSIFVVDDDPAVLSSLVALLQAHNYTALTFRSAEEFLSKVALDQPGCVVTDLQMAAMSGLELQRQLCAQQCVMSVIVVTGTSDVATAVQIMEAGAITLLEKPYSQEALLNAIKLGLQNSETRWQQRQKQSRLQARLESLTDEELRVMRLLVRGESNKSISQILDISSRTLDRRRQSVMKKFGVDSIAALVFEISQLPIDDARLA